MKNFILIIAFLFTFQFLHAYEIKVSSSYKYNSWSLTDDDRNTAVTELKKAALKKYTNEKFSGNKSAYREFKKVEAQIQSNIDDYVNVISYLVDDNDKKNKTLNLTAKVEILEMDLEYIIFDSSAIGNAMPSEISEIAIFTVAAKAKKLNVFDPKKTAVEKISTETYNSEISQVDNTGAEVTTSSESTDISQSGGSTEFKSSELEYGPIQGLDEQLFAKSAQIFNDNMFEPIDASQFLDSSISEEYITGDSLSRDTKNYIYKTVIDYEIPFLILSKLKVDSLATDPDTGMPMISLIAITEVYECERFCKSIATVGPERRQAIGNNENEAITNALILAVESSSQQSVDMMNAKGVR